ncbi:MAG TPA: LamG domain-containing protein [Kofleriaceae bacterium]
MRAVVLLCVLVGCDGIWDLEHVPAPDSGGTLAPGLAAWFPMDSVESGMIVEVVGGGFGSCTGSSCPTLTEGVRGGALLFDGVRQMVTAPSPATLNVRASFTIAVWTRIDVIPDVLTCSVNKLHLGPVDNSWQFCTTKTAAGSYWLFLGGAFSAPGPMLDVGQWHHLAATWDAMTTELRLYQDGFGVGDVLLVNLAFDDGHITIGADVDQGQPFGFFPGALDEFRIYTRALAADEILALAQLR